MMTDLAQTALIQQTPRTTVSRSLRWILGDDARRPEQVNAAAPGEAGGDTACIVTDPEAELHFSEAELHLTSRAVCDDPTCLSGRGIAREGVTSVAMESELEQDQAEPFDRASRSAGRHNTSIRWSRYTAANNNDTSCTRSIQVTSASWRSPFRTQRCAPLTPICVS